jgi:hypothetical protein
LAGDEVDCSLCVGHNFSKLKGRPKAVSVVPIEGNYPAKKKPPPGQLHLRIRSELSRTRRDHLKSLLEAQEWALKIAIGKMGNQDAS